MTQEKCFGCQEYMSNILIRRLHDEWEQTEGLKSTDANPFPLDVAWKNCSAGPDVWLNCRARLKEKRIGKAFDGYLSSIRRR